MWLAWRVRFHSAASKGTPDSNLLVDTKGHHKARRIKNHMDEVEANDCSCRQKACILCGEGHARKDCNMHNVGKDAKGADVRRVPTRKS